MATTTNYTWTTPDNTAYVKDGASAIRTLGSSVDSTLFTALGGAYAGLRLIKKQAVGTGVTTISVTSAFSAAYENYRIVFNSVSGVGGSGIQLQLNGITGSVYQDTGFYMTYGSGTVNGVGGAAGTAFNCAYNNATPGGASFQMDLMSPFLSQRKNMSTTGQANNGTTVSIGTCTSTSSATGFTIIRSGADTMTGGNIYVYGYGAS